MRRPLLAVSFFLAPLLFAQDWPQWGRTPNHEGSSSVIAQPLQRVHGEVDIDPFAPAIKQNGGGNLLVHYPVPLVDGADIFVMHKGGTLATRQAWQSQTWQIRDLRWSNGQLTERWTFTSDWKPVPVGSGGAGPAWEPVFHCAVTRDSLWSPGLGGTVIRLNRSDGSAIARVNPFGPRIDPTIFVSSPLTVDSSGNVYYNAIQLDAQAPWTSDVRGGWLIRAGVDGSVTKIPYATLLPDVPRGTDLCSTQFDVKDLPFPPSPDAIAPRAPCGSQRPGLNVTPAIGDDGTIYTVSRAHFNGRWGYLIAVNRDLSPKWAATLRNRFSDGCGVFIPPNGTAGGCREGAHLGVDPADNELGSGRVQDDSTSSPVVTPSNTILYGAYSRYNYSQGHLMSFGADGTYLGAYPFGWDITPAIYRHDGTFSIVIKENRYSTGAYCAGNPACPSDRTATTPSDPEQYFITQLDPLLGVEWKFRSSNTLNCATTNGIVECVDDHPQGFEWCVNAIAIDGRGVVYANSEDGRLYAIRQGGFVDESIFLRTALGAAYTPLAIGSDGMIYTQNDGTLFAVGAGPRRRPVRRSE